jgi:excisionase family DNA binding protein
MTKTYEAKTRGSASRCVRFTWGFDEEIGMLSIETEKGRLHRFHMDEILKILNTVKSEFGRDYFPLANNVAKLDRGTEIRGLGTIILDGYPGDVTHAQGSSYLGPVLEQIGYFKWNGKNRGIKWQLVDHKISHKLVIERLKNPMAQRDSEAAARKNIKNDMLLTIDELAKRLKVPKSWIYARTRESGPGSMPRIKVGKYLRFRWDDVLAWLQSKQRNDK